ncbi:Slam-dependent surface lipoprotein [Haemophilus sputorum]|uniref:Transferrin-binding protein 2 n=1 Tax=Haemophilus sputorum TaxID=1078480 RepID=A0ABX9HS97_9PAST|nr:Slam-dependent surface lipoprotein [Haemophilus sputorum]RDF09111.1 transferrin-binding protein 2 [Haemophilus sputorum]RDF12441.1 transferrin-binding protein 2 [Haemophilus sputorum]
MSSLNHVFKFGATALAALVLSACGSSGGGSNNNEATPANNQTQQNQSNPSAANNSAQPNQQASSGTGAALVASDSTSLSIRRVELKGYNTTSINVDGTNVAIGFPGISAGDWLNAKANGRDLKVCCGIYSDMRFGLTDSLDDNGNAYVFYNGNPTRNMPTSGSASYSGQSIISANVPALDKEGFYTGTSQFNVDFGNKTLNGYLGINNIQPVNINASISGNSFNGTATSSSLPSAGRVEGKFYGDQAKQLAGLAQANDNNWGAVFGAQKQ